MYVKACFVSTINLDISIQYLFGPFGLYSIAAATHAPIQRSSCWEKIDWKMNRVWWFHGEKKENEWKRMLLRYGKSSYYMPFIWRVHLWIKHTVEPIQSILLWIENQQRLEAFHILCASSLCNHALAIGKYGESTLFIDWQINVHCTLYHRYTYVEILLAPYSTNVHFSSSKVGDASITLL